MVWPSSEITFESFSQQYSPALVSCISCYIHMRCLKEAWGIINKLLIFQIVKKCSVKTAFAVLHCLHNLNQPPWLLCCMAILLWVVMSFCQGHVPKSIKNPTISTVLSKLPMCVWYIPTYYSFPTLCCHIFFFMQCLTNCFLKKIKDSCFFYRRSLLTLSEMLTPANLINWPVWELLKTQ